MKVGPKSSLKPFLHRALQLMIERLDSNNCAGPNKHRIGWSAPKTNNHTDPN